MYSISEIQKISSTRAPMNARPLSVAFEQSRDRRFEMLLGKQEWTRLPAAIRRRFSKRLSCGESVAYQGVVTHMSMTGPGRALAMLARLIGSPLPFDSSSVSRSAVVVVTEDAATGGQIWIRQYGRASGFPQAVSSSKRFEGPTGLEEHIGYGIVMALRLQACSDALHFLSAGYFLKLGPRRLRLPGWLSPGQLKISHEELGNGCFEFSLVLTHRMFGMILSQSAVFKDADPIGL